MTTLIEDYLREVESSLRVDAARKRQIVDELRTHLTEKVNDLQSAEPIRPRMDIEQEVLREFGNPRDLALAYEPDGTAVLRSAAGDVVVRLGRAAKAVGRGTGTFLKWTAVALAVLLVVALGVGAWAYYEVKPYIPSMIESSEPVYSYYERCEGTPCSGSAPADTFYVRPDAKTVRFDFDIWYDHLDPGENATNGSVRVAVTDPNGVARFDRTFDSRAEPPREGSYERHWNGGMHQETSWEAVPGNWTVAYTYVDFVGMIDVETYAWSFPFDER